MNSHEGMSIRDIKERMSLLETNLCYLKSPTLITLQKKELAALRAKLLLKQPTRKLGSDFSTQVGN